MSIFFMVLKQSLALSFRKGGGALGALAFYTIMVTLFVFTLGPQALRSSLQAVCCVSLFLANIVTLPYLFERDHEDGTLEQLLLQPVAFELLILAKLCGQWLAVMLPITLLSPVIGIMAGLGVVGTAKMAGVLLLVSPSMMAIASLAAAFTLGNKRGGLLQALLVLPLSMPLLIFSAQAQGHGAMFFLTAILFASLPLCCWINAELARLAQE